MYIKNEPKVEEIIYEDTLINFCPIGKSLYRNNLTITIHPNKILPDYIELHQEIRGLEGKNLIIEEVVDLVLEIVKRYHPNGAIVTTVVDDANHPKVTISKSYVRTVEELLRGCNYEKETY
jgi:hypothetical protein